jgi:bifunctional ADP-heptose synthase (sugar kinase/adenylyltransferase)
MCAALGVDVSLITVAAFEDLAWIKRELRGFCRMACHDGITTRRERFYHADGSIAGPRLDFNSDAAEISDLDQMTLASFALATAPNAVIVCDHARGAVGPALMERLKASGIPVFVDPHPSSDFKSFAGVECLAMNREEAFAATDAEPEPKNLITKFDADGLCWFREGWLFAQKQANDFDSHRLHFPSMAREVVDPIGAGDQFIAALATSRVLGMEWETSIMRANAAAGLQCGQRGMRPVSAAEIDNRLRIAFEESKAGA